MDGRASQPAEERTAWFTLALLLLMSTVSTCDRNILALLVAPIKADLGINDFQISLLQGISFSLFYAVFGLPMGWLVDRYSRRVIIAGGMAAWSLATASCGLAGSFLLLALARFAVGIGESTLSPAAFSILSDRFPPQRLAFAINVFLAGSATGAGLSYYGGAVLFAHGAELGQPTLPIIGAVSPWQYVFIILGVPGALIAPLIFLVPEPARRLHQKQAGADRTTLLAFLYRRRAYLTVVFAALSIIGMLTYGTGGWLVTYLLRTYGVSIQTAGGATGFVVMTTGICGFLFSGWLADRLYASGADDAHLKPLLFGFPIVLILAIVGFGLMHNMWVALACCGTMFFILSSGQCLASHVQLTTPPELRGQLSALYLFIYVLVGQASGPSIVAAFTEYLFRDPNKLGWSIALNFVLLSPIAFGLLALGRRYARDAMADMQSIAMKTNAR
jgi:MFS family permease